MLTDQVGRAESVNAVGGVLAGLGAVVTTLAGIVSHLISSNVGRAGVATAGLSVVLAVAGLIVRRPGREPVDLDNLLSRILHTEDVTLTEDVLPYTDVAAAKRNDSRLKAKAAFTLMAAVTLAGGFDRGSYNHH